MDLLQKQRESVANHIRLENEHQWADVKTTLVQDDWAFFDFVPVGQFKSAEGLQQFYQGVSTAFPDLHIEVTADTTWPAALFVKDISLEHTWVNTWGFQQVECRCVLP